MTISHNPVLGNNSLFESTMVKFLELALALIAIGGVGGVGNQFFVLILLGFASREGHLQIPAEFGFIQSPIFLIPVTIYWLIALLAELSLTPAFVHTCVRQLSKYVNTSLAPAFGAVLALMSVGIVTNSSEQFRDVSSFIQLLSPGELLTAHTFGLIVAILAGTAGAAFLSLLFSMLSHTVNVSLYKEHGGNNFFPPLFDNGAVLIALMIIYFLKDTNPLTIAICLIGFLAFLLLFAFRFSRQVFAVVNHVMKRPKDGLWLTLEFFVWGRGGAMVGEPRADVRTKHFVFFGALYVGFTLGLLLIPLAGFLFGFWLQPVAGLVYVYYSRQSAQTLWKFLQLKKLQSVERQTVNLHP